MWQIVYFLDFFKFFLLTPILNLSLTMEMKTDFRINVVLYSLAHSNRRLWHAADGVLYSDLPPHSQGCSTFCEPFSPWIIDRKLSAGCEGFHILPAEWRDFVCVTCYFKAVCFSNNRALAQLTSVGLKWEVEITIYLIMQSGLMQCCNSVGASKCGDCYVEIKRWTKSLICSERTEWHYKCVASHHIT